MKINLAELGSHIKNGLKTCYLISTNELLLAEETAFYLKKIAKQQGFTEIQRYTIDAKFNWTELKNNQNTLSLFDEKKIIEIILPQPKITKDTGEFFKNLTPDDNTFWLIRCPKLAQTEQKAAWLNALDAVGIIIQIADIKKIDLPQWIAKRLSRLGYQTSSEALQLIADQCEDNLLAAKQLIEKMSLRYPAGNLTLTQVSEFLHDTAQFDYYALLDSILSLQLPRSQRILSTLRAGEGEPTLTLWIIQKELHLLALCKQTQEKKGSLQQLFKEQGVWSSRQGPLQKHLKQFSSTQYYELLAYCHRVDRYIKSTPPDVAWNALENLVIACCSTAAVSVITSSITQYPDVIL